MATPTPANILLRGANWVGDAVMTLPAMRALASHYPQSRLTVLARPWSLAVYQNQPGVAAVLAQAPDGAHRGLGGRLRLARELASQKFDLAVLFQNAFEAALITALARIPRRWGYARDGRSFLLSQAVEVEPADLRAHESFYYLNLLERLGVPAPFTRPRLRLNPDDQAEAETMLGQARVGRDDFLLALAPGAAFGSAKRWPVEHFAETARLISGECPGRVLILGGPGEIEDAARLAALLPGRPVNLAGRTSLSVSMALLARASLLVTNDSGLMHLAGALEVPLVAVFGPTNPQTTAPLGRSRLIRSTASCAPCLKRECPLPKRICFDSVTPDRVAEAAVELLHPPAAAPGRRPAVFLDRDGTLIEEVAFLSRPEQVRLLPGAGRAVADLNRAGYAVALVTNQSGVARGLFTVEDLGRIHDRLTQLLAEEGARLDGLYFCPHHPEGAIPEFARSCGCRKPGPGLFHQAAQELRLDPARSIWVGDRWRDLAAAAPFGGRSVLVLTGYGLEETGRPECRPTLVAPDLRRAVEWIRS